MTGCRHALLQHQTLALTIVLLALMARMLIPTGYMPGVQNGRFVMTLCPGQAPVSTTLEAMAGMNHRVMPGGHPASPNDHGADHMKEAPCAFAGLALASTAAADPVLLALAILFIVTRVYRRPPPLPAAIRFRWPPRTGPPLRI